MSMTGVLRPGHVQIRVLDMDESVKFYTDVMGLKPMGKDAQGFKPSPTAIGGATTSAVFIVKNLPDSIKTLGSTLKSSIDFAKTNNIPVPKEANDATALL